VGRGQAALLAAFIGHEGWGLDHGLNESSGDPCAAGEEWEGITCDNSGGRVTMISLGPSLRGELGAALGKLTALTKLCAARADPSACPPSSPLPVWLVSPPV